MVYQFDQSLKFYYSFIIDIHLVSGRSPRPIFKWRTDSEKDC